MTKVSTSPALVAILQTCLARTRTFKGFRDESFHLTGFAGKNTSTPNLAILMQKMNVDASFVTDYLLQAHAELAHSSNSHAQNPSRPQVGKMTHCQSANVSVKVLKSQIYQCQSTIANVIDILPCECPKMNAIAANSQQSCSHDAITLSEKSKWGVHQPKAPRFQTKAPCYPGACVRARDAACAPSFARRGPETGTTYEYAPRRALWPTVPGREVQARCKWGLCIPH